MHIYIFMTQRFFTTSVVSKYNYCDEFFFKVFNEHYTDYRILQTMWAYSRKYKSGCFLQMYSVCPYSTVLDCTPNNCGFCARLPYTRIYENMWKSFTCTANKLPARFERRNKIYFIKTWTKNVYYRNTYELNAKVQVVAEFDIDTRVASVNKIIVPPRFKSLLRNLIQRRHCHGNF